MTRASALVKELCWLNKHVAKSVAELERMRTRRRVVNQMLERCPKKDRDKAIKEVAVPPMLGSSDDEH